VAARTGSPGEYVEYAGSKAFIEAFTLGLARELGPAGVLVNAVSPGIVATSIHARSGEPGRPARLAEQIPLRRPGRPEEVADAVGWLLSPEASYTSGTVLTVSGGL
jgi:NAD(P)-dependent dehydrogenase (short-subunit alcohol dehydrogenase family)